MLNVKLKNKVRKSQQLYFENEKGSTGNEVFGS